jgi:hypothetical protein
LIQATTYRDLSELTVLLTWHVDSAYVPDNQVSGGKTHPKVRPFQEYWRFRFEFSKWLLSAVLPSHQEDPLLAVNQAPTLLTIGETSSDSCPKPANP